MEVSGLFHKKKHSAFSLEMARFGRETEALLKNCTFRDHNMHSGNTCTDGNGM